VLNTTEFVGLHVGLTGTSICHVGLQVQLLTVNKHCWHQADGRVSNSTDSL